MSELEVLGSGHAIVNLTEEGELCVVTVVGNGLVLGRFERRDSTWVRMDLKSIDERKAVIDDALVVVESYKYGEYSAVSDDAPEDSVEVLRAKAVESTVEGILGELRELRKRECAP